MKELQWEAYISIYCDTFLDIFSTTSASLKRC
jgi:hypothetical protein